MESGYKMYSAHKMKRTKFLNSELKITLNVRKDLPCQDKTIRKLKDGCVFLKKSRVPLFHDKLPSKLDLVGVVF